MAEKGISPLLSQYALPWSAQWARKSAVPMLSRSWTRCDVGTAEQIHVLSALPGPELKSLTPHMLCRSFSRGQEVDWGETEVEGAILGVVQGGVNLSIRSAQGRELPVLAIGRGHVYDTGQEWPEELDQLVVHVTEEPTIVCVAPRRLLIKMVAGTPEAAEDLLTEYGLWLAAWSEIARARLHGPASRVRQVLWREARDAPEQVVSFTHEQLATRALTDRARTSKIIARLRQDGLIEVDQALHRIVVIDLQGLIEAD